MKPFEQSHYRKIYIQIAEVDAEYMPEDLYIYFTSEVNSYGKSLNWWDGDVFEQRLHWKKYVQVNLKPFKYRYLGEDLNCSEHSNIARFKSILKDANFSWCQEKCSPFNFLDDLFPQCGLDEDKKDERNCANFYIKGYWVDFTISHGYKKPCTVLEYQGKKTNVLNQLASNKAVLEYRFAPPMMTKVQQEYLIFDVIGMIGSVGGSLGMCIGFSFSGVTTYILDFIQSRIINNN